MWYPNTEEKWCYRAGRISLILAAMPPLYLSFYWFSIYDKAEFY